MFYLNKGGGVSTIKDLDDLDDLTEDDLEKTTIVGRYWMANQNAMIQKWEG